MKNHPTVEIYVSNFTWKVLQNRYEYDGYAVDVFGTWLYPLLTQHLTREREVKPKRRRITTQSDVKVRIYISEYDRQRYGSNIKLENQARLSLFIKKMEIDDACKFTCMAHVFSDASRDSVMKYYLEKHDYTEEEIHFAALKKHYQRHYACFETIYQNDLLTIKNNLQNVLK